MGVKTSFFHNPEPIGEVDDAVRVDLPADLGRSDVAAPLGHGLGELPRGGLRLLRPVAEGAQHGCQGDQHGGDHGYEEPAHLTESDVRSDPGVS